LAEELLPHDGAAETLEALVFAVHALFHAAAQQARLVTRQQAVPVRSPQALDDVPSRAAEGALELLDDLAVAAHRAVQPLQVAVDDPNQVVELLARAQRQRPQRLRLVGFAVAHEGPNLAIR